MLDLSLTTRAYFPAFVGFFVRVIVKPGPTVPSSFGVAAPAGSATTAALAVKAREDAAERASFDPFFTFFQGGVAAFEDGRRVGAIGVSGLPGPDDDALARRALEAAGLSTQG